MIPRDWTLTDQADAADAECDRNWWRRDPYAEPFDEPADDEPQDTDNA
jgi:hypothetical protein